MTYDIQERSFQSGEPVELYEFRRGGNFWRYTTDPEPIEYNFADYSPELIKRTGIDHTPETAKSNLTITLPRDNPVADMFRIAPPSDVILITVRRMHRGDTDAVIVWSGRVLNAEWKGATASLTCEPVSSSMARPGLRRLYTRACPLVLYECGVVKAGKAVPAYLETVSGSTIEAAIFDTYVDGYFDGGFIEVSNGDGTFERRGIRGHVSQTLTLSLPLPSLAPGSLVTAYPGCDHSLTTCASKFDNSDNYGGWPFVPVKNPYAGQALY